MTRSATRTKRALPAKSQNLARLANPRRLARLAKLRKLAATLPHISDAPVGDGHVAFRVGKKTLAWYLNNHHGDGIIALCCKSTMERQRQLIARDPQRYYYPAYVGAKGWVALRLDLPRVDWGEVLERFVDAYRLGAPRRLAAELE